MGGCLRQVWLYEKKNKKKTKTTKIVLIQYMSRAKICRWLKYHWDKQWRAWLEYTCRCTGWSGSLQFCFVRWVFFLLLSLSSRFVIGWWESLSFVWLFIFVWLLYCKIWFPITEFIASFVSFFFPTLSLTHKAASKYCSRWHSKKIYLFF